MKRFLDWLTDPVLNGAGALYDFGCYGANLATWIFDGKEPLSVSAVLQHTKPEVYPKVEDDATVVRGQIHLAPSDQQALENNITVVKILEAAKRSAATGKAVILRK